MRLSLPPQQILKWTLTALVIFYGLIFLSFVLRCACGCGFDFTSARVLGFITLAWFLTPFIAIFTLLLDLKVSGELKFYSITIALPLFCLFTFICFFPIGEAIEAFQSDQNLSFEFINREIVNSIVDRAYYVSRGGALSRDYAVSRSEVKLLPGVIWFYSETRKPSL